MAGQAVVRIGDRLWTVSLAATPQELVRGLGGLSSIPPGTGMLFDMGQEQTVTVTTAPMLFPIDIVFCDSSLVVNGLARGVAPGYLVTTEAPARFFLEVNAGEAGSVLKGEPAAIQGVYSEAQSPFGQVISLIASLFTLSLVVSLVRSFVRGVLPVPRRAAGPGLIMAKTNAELIEPEVGVLPQVIVNEDFLDNLQSLLDENKKTDSLRKLEATLNKLTPEQRQSIDGLEDLKRAIEDYRAITRQGLTPEDYIEEKESAWSDIEDALGNLSLWEEDAEQAPGTEPKTLPAAISAALPKLTAAGQSVSPVGKKLAPSEVDFFADSADHCCGSLDRSGLRPRLEKAFLTAIARVKGG